MIGTAPDERLGCRALHISPGGDRWALAAYTRTSTTQAAEEYSTVQIAGYSLRRVQKCVR